MFESLLLPEFLFSITNHLGSSIERQDDDVPKDGKLYPE